MSGARYIDLRVGSSSDGRCRRRRRNNATVILSSSVNEIDIVHGILNGAPFPDMIHEVDRFLHAHDGEFVIIDIQFDPNKHRLSAQQRFHLMEFVSHAFKDKLITHADVMSWFQLNDVTLGELILFRKKNILILLNDGMLNDLYHDGTSYDVDTIAQKFGCHGSRFFLTNQWHNTACPRTLLEKNVSFLKKNENCYNRFVVSQLVLTPQPPKVRYWRFCLIYILIFHIHLYIVTSDAQ